MQLKKHKIKPGSRGGRTTRRQRGGDPWSMITKGIADREVKWTEALSSNPLLIINWSSEGDETPPNKRLEQWVNSIMYQEKLFEIAFNLYKTHNNKEYFEDVVRMINFSYNTGGSKSKINLLIDNKLKEDESGLTDAILKFFPDAFSNSVITSIASIIDLIAKDPSQLKVDKTALVRYFNSITNANAWLLTGYSMRDGFYLDQGQSDFTTKFSGFYVGFIESLIELQDDLPKKVAAALNGKNDTPKDWQKNIWSFLAALVAALHMKGELNTILTYFDSPRQDASSALFGNFQSAPDENLLKVPLANGLNLYTIMATLVVGTVKGNHISGDSLFHYIVHLSKRVAEISDTKFEEVTASKFFAGTAAVTAGGAAGEGAGGAAAETAVVPGATQPAGGAVQSAREGAAAETAVVPGATQPAGGAVQSAREGAAPAPAVQPAPTAAGGAATAPTAVTAAVTAAAGGAVTAGGAAEGAAVQTAVPAEGAAETAPAAQPAAGRS